MPVIPDRRIAEMIVKGELMTIPQAAKKYNLPHTAIRGWIRRGLIESYRLSPKYTYVYTRQIEEKLLFYTPRPSQRRGQVMMDL